MGSLPLSDRFAFLFLSQTQDGKLGRELQESCAFYQDLVLDHASRARFLCIIAVLVIVCGRLLNFLWKFLPERDFVVGKVRGGHFLCLVYCYFICWLFGGKLLRMILPATEIGDYLLYWAVNAAFCACVWAVAVAQQDDIRVLGCRSISFRDTGVVLGSYVLFLPLFLGSYFVNSIGFASLGIEPHAQEVAERLASARGWTFWAGVVTAVIGAPLLEEFIFRVFLYGSVRKFMGVPAALLLSSIIFAVSHGEVFVYFPIFMLGAFLAILYEKTQSLLAPVLAHALHNGVTICYINFSVGSM